METRKYTIVKPLTRIIVMLRKNVWWL